MFRPMFRWCSDDDPVCFSDDPVMFRSRSSGVPVMFRRYYSYGSDRVPVLLLWCSGHVPLMFWGCYGCVSVLLMQWYSSDVTVMFQPCCSDVLWCFANVPDVFRDVTVYVSVMFRRCSSNVPVMFRVLLLQWYSIDVTVMFRWCSCSSDVPVMFWPCSARAVISTILWKPPQFRRNSGWLQPFLYRHTPRFIVQRLQPFLSYNDFRVKNPTYPISTKIGIRLAVGMVNTSTKAQFNTPSRFLVRAVLGLYLVPWHNWLQSN